jgi:FtsH-binding integral membrane protein
MAFRRDQKFSLRTNTMSADQAHASGIDVGLREYMLRVYNFMASGLALTGIIALAASQSAELMQAIHGTGLRWIVMFGPIGFVFFLSARIHAIKASTAQALFWVYAAMMGLMMSYVFLAYTGESVARVFFITSGTFAAMSLYGYTTKRDLTGLGSFMMMGLIGIIIAMVVNIFLQSAAMQFIISVLGVLIFVGLTAYDTQKIKNMYSAVDSSEIAGKKAIMGALTLYLDFINLFIMLLSLFGDRR